MHSVAGKYIRDAILEAIQKAFAEEIHAAKQRLDKAKKDDTGIAESLDAYDDLLHREVIRYDVDLVYSNAEKYLCIPFEHLGWGAPYTSDVKYYAPFHTMRIKINIEPAEKDYGHSHCVKMVDSYPIDEHGNALTWKQIARDSTRLEGEFYDIAAAELVALSQRAPSTAIFVDKETGKSYKIEDNKLYSKGDEIEWVDEGKLGVWVSDTCFVCGNDVYKKEDLDWEERYVIPETKDEPAEPESEPGTEKAEPVSDDKVRIEKGKIEEIERKIEESAPATAAM